MPYRGAMVPYRRRTVGRAASSYQRKRARNLIRKTVFRMAEMKHLDTGLASSTMQAAAYSAPITLITQGTAVNNRIANQVRVKRIYLRGYVTAAAGAPRDVVRVMLVLDNQPNGAAPTVSGSNGILKSLAVDSNYNLDLVAHGMGPQRYRILMDRVIVLNNNDAATVTKTVYFKKSWSVDIPITYQSNAGTISDLGSKNIQFIAFSTTSGTLASVAASAQLCFIDA